MKMMLTGDWSCEEPPISNEGRRMPLVCLMNSMISDGQLERMLSPGVKARTTFVKDSNGFPARRVGRGYLRYDRATIRQFVFLTYE